ncbi:zinc ribbon domain-containing protein [Brachyspira aalborgi]|uniref:zinc ribbon domain-containing protein n=1 Tax=Brachyspira aalborgi TaxID=29522 RepID=UPI002666C393|nr:zinc ribbon domain-containing protein [Brachyspira aalborgi]
MFCSKCGTQLNEDAKFCNNCGERIIVNSTQNNETFQNNTTNVENTESNKQSFFEKFKKLTKEEELNPEEGKELLDNHNKYLAAFFM